MKFKVYDPIKLLDSLVALPRETGWLEFKENRFNEESIGKYVSALANSAMLEHKDVAYLVFGVRDGSHQIVGTTVDLAGETVGAESFILWLNKYLTPKIIVHHIPFEYSGKRIEMLCIEPNYERPVKFKQSAYIRIDDSLVPLGNHPEKERALWQITSSYSFERSTIESHVTQEQMLSQFETDKLFKALNVTADSNKMVFEQLLQRNIIKDNLQGGYEVSALLAIAAANNFNEFPLLTDRGSRVVVFKGRSKLEGESDIEGHKGYLVSFIALLAHIMSCINSEEEIQHGVRTTIYDIPEISIREFLANALVHQDFTQTGSRPLVEVFKDRIVIVNPGEPLVEVDRFIDTPSKTRNPDFAKLMRDAGYCEQRGSGVDRAINAIEQAGLPPPLIESIEGMTVVTVYAYRAFADMTREDRIRACFQHASLSYASGEYMSNASLRSRFRLSTRQYPQVSNVIRDSIEDGKIRPLSQDQGNRNARYVPYYVM